MPPHPLFVPNLGACEVRWYEKWTERVPALEYANSRRVLESLRPLAEEYATHGRILLVPINGHPLQGERYRKLYAIKPTKSTRFYGFRLASVFYIAVGADKVSQKEQVKDYESALKALNDLSQR